MGSGPYDALSELRIATSKKLEDLTRKLEGNRDAETENKRMRAILERVMDSAVYRGHIVHVGDDQADKNSMITVSCDGRLLDVMPVPDLELKVGDGVRLLPSSSQIVGLSDKLDVGSVCFVRQIIGNDLCEVDFSGSPRRVLTGSFGGKIESQGRVILDSSGSVVIAYLGKVERENFKTKPKATWDDIVGLDDMKRELREALELPFKKDRPFIRYKRNPMKGAFIWGPPGCGKTMLGEATANFTAELYSAEAMASGYFYVRGPEFLDMYVGNTEKAIRNLDEQAREHHRKYGFPAIIFIDEAEALLSRRGSGKSSDMEKTVVPTFLGVMNQSTAIYLLATNKQNVIDPAVIRDGRITHHFNVSRPTREDSQKIIAKNLKRYPLYPDTATPESLGIYASNLFYSDNYVLIDEGIPLKDGKKKIFTMGSIVNGAMLAGIVDRASAIAERRDRTTGKETGINEADLLAAIEQNYQQKKGLDHQDELREFMTSIKDQIDRKALLQVSEV